MTRISSTLSAKARCTCSGRAGSPTTTSPETATRCLPWGSGLRSWSMWW
uniref:Uncharacterized protein n=1 Tax=Arundo donax TaxID=35708 RepID=A0A0A9G232_ARUDO